MSGQLTIGRARTRARLVGAPANAAGVERQLGALLAGPVAGRVGQMADRLAEGEVICLPEVTLKLRLTLADLQGSAAADIWAGQIEAAVEQALLGGPGAAPVQRFASRAAYHAAYIRHRLGLFPAARGVFQGFATLDLLSPARAMAEMLATDPTLWTELAVAGPAAALDLLRAVLAQGGEGVVRMILSEAVRRGMGRLAAAQGGAGGSAVGLGAVLAHLTRLSADWPVAMRQPWQAVSPVARGLLAALTLGPLPQGVGAVAAGEVLACLMVLVRQGESGLTEGQLGTALARLAVEHPDLAAAARSLQALVLAGSEAEAQVLTLLPRILALVGGAEAVTQPKAEGPRDGARAREAVDLRHFASPFAGVALVLPHLAEDGIGRAFGAERVQLALAELVRSDLFPRPEESDFLRALSGTLQQEPPDRPTARDLLFIPKARHAEILQAEAGAPRLAAWLMGRFAATLPGLGASSLGFLQRQFFHRGGEVWLDPRQITLRLDPLPLRAVLEVAGRLGPDLARADWLERQSLTIRCDDGR